MAFDLTKPSMLGATLAGEFGNIRENFRAIVQGDSGTFTGLYVSTLGAAASGNILIASDGSDGPWIAGNTDSAGKSTINIASMRNRIGGAGFHVQYSASTPVGTLRTWTTGFLVDTTGAVGIKGSPSGGYSLTVNCAAATQTPAIQVTGSTTAAAYINVNNTTGAIVLGVESSVGGSILTNAGAYAGVIYTGNSSSLIFGTSSTARLTITTAGNIIPNAGALSTSATDGFMYTNTCAGAPSGTPTAFTGRSAMIYDTTNNKLWVYNGAWKGVVLT